MPQTCTVCRHPERDQIDEALLSGEPYRHLAKRTETSTASLRRHRKNHIPLALAQSQQVEVIARGDRLVDNVRHLHQEALSILARAKAKADFKAALAAIEQARGLAELLAQVKVQDERTRRREMRLEQSRLGSMDWDRTPG